MCVCVCQCVLCVYVCVCSSAVVTYFIIKRKDPLSFVKKGKAFTVYQRLQRVEHGTVRRQHLVEHIV